MVEDDPELRGLLEHLLGEEGHHAAAVPDGIAALDWAARGAIRPDLILADYNLPNGMDGLQVTDKLREKLGARDPGGDPDRRHFDRHAARYRAA